MLDRRDFSPIGFQRVNKTTGEQVEFDQIIKGYQYKPGEYVVLTDEDFRDLVEFLYPLSTHRCTQQPVGRLAINLRIDSKEPMPDKPLEAQKTIGRRRLNEHSTSSLSCLSNARSSCSRCGSSEWMPERRSTSGRSCST